MDKKIKIGLLVEDDFISAWSYEMVKNLDSSPACEIKLVIRNRICYRNPDLNSNKYIAYRLFNHIDRKSFRSKPDAFEQKKLGDLIAPDIQTVRSKLINYTLNFEDEDLDEIKKSDLDIIVNLCSYNPEGTILALPKYGIWSYQIGTKVKKFNYPPGFWEVFNRHPETEVLLQVLATKEENCKTLYRSYSLTDNLSVARSLNSLYWKSCSFLPKKIEELYQEGAQQFFAKLTGIDNESPIINGQSDEIPTNLKMLRIWFLFNLERWKKAVYGLYYLEQWMLLFEFRTVQDTFGKFQQFRKILPPKDRFWADPFIIAKNNLYYIFIEELLYKDDKGFISVIEMDKQGNYKKPVKVLEEDYHLSFPFLIEHEGNIFMIPETKNNNSIQIYRSVEFPNKWELEMKLIENIKAVDTVIYYHDDKYWLFTNKITNNGASFHDELFLYYSKNLLTQDWISHPQNPIVSDVKNARQAGGLFEYKGHLYRPSQNCSHRYGYGMKMNKILEMNMNSYVEETVDSVIPDWDPHIQATHTINTSTDLTVIDAKMTRTKYFKLN